ncbi:MAG: hypothetical protein K2P93_05970 [Alphaproteobacteria bacterium]|nr:hypothetical protein [Alphaproteobacteria bacterium]
MSKYTFKVTVSAFIFCFSIISSLQAMDQEDKSFSHFPQQPLHREMLPSSSSPSMHSHIAQDPEYASVELNEEISSLFSFPSLTSHEEDPVIPVVLSASTLSDDDQLDILTSSALESKRSIQEMSSSSRSASSYDYTKKIVSANKANLLAQNEGLQLEDVHSDNPVELFERAESIYKNFKQRTWWEPNEAKLVVGEQALKLYRNAISDNSPLTQSLLGPHYKKALYRIVSIFAHKLSSIQLEGNYQLASQIFKEASPYFLSATHLNYWRASEALGAYWHFMFYGYQKQKNVEMAEVALRNRSYWFDKCFAEAQAFEAGPRGDLDRKKVMRIYDDMHEDGRYLRATHRAWQLCIEDQNITKAQYYAKEAVEYCIESKLHKPKEALVAAEMYMKSQLVPNELLFLIFRYEEIAHLSAYPIAFFRSGWIRQHNPTLKGNKKWNNPFNLFRLAADKGVSEAQFMMGHDARRRENHLEAFNQFKNAANQGHLAASLALADMFLKRQGTQGSEAQAFYWFKKSYQNDRFREAWASYFNQSQSETEAFRLFKENVHTGAIEYTLANDYLSKGDYRQYFSCLVLASEKKYPDALSKLAQHYENGYIGIAPNTEEAHKLKLQLAQESHLKAKL